MSSNDFHQYVMEDLLNGMDGITSRQMFGGYGLYKNGIIFALIAEDTLYFKVDDSNKEEYKKRNSKPFTYSKGNHKPTTMSYWEVPADVLDDKSKLAEWIDTSYSISLKAKHKK